MQYLRNKGKMIIFACFLKLAYLDSNDWIKIEKQINKVKIEKKDKKRLQVNFSSISFFRFNWFNQNRENNSRCDQMECLDPKQWIENHQNQKKSSIFVLNWFLK